MIKQMVETHKQLWQHKRERWLLIGLYSVLFGATPGALGIVLDPNAVDKWFAFVPVLAILSWFVILQFSRQRASKRLKE
jgi:hypothetical protein